MKNLAIFLLSFLILGCLISKDKLEGNYTSSDFYGIVNEIELRSDKTFYYHWQIGLNSGTITGKYEKQGEYLILNGDTKPADQRIRVEESLRDNSDSIYIHVKDFDNTPIAFSSIILSTEQMITTDIDGKAVIRKIADVKKVKVLHLSFDTLEYQIKDAKSNYFLIQTYYYLKQEVYFDNVQVQIKGSALIMTGNPLSKGYSIIFDKSR